MSGHCCESSALAPVGCTPASLPAESDGLQRQSHLHVQLWHQQKTVDCSGSHWESIDSAAGEQWGLGGGRMSSSVGWQGSFDSPAKPPQAQLTRRSPNAHTQPDSSCIRGKFRFQQAPEFSLRALSGESGDFSVSHLSEAKNQSYIYQLNSPCSQLFLGFCVSTNLQSLARKAASKAPNL